MLKEKITTQIIDFGDFIANSIDSIFKKILPFIIGLAAGYAWCWFATQP